MNTEKLIIGTRGSALARWQAAHIGQALRDAHPGLVIEERIIVTEGDRFQSGPLIEIGGKGVWVKEIEQALLNGDIDLAVHSLKDVPAELAPGLTLGALPKRADARDALVSRGGESLMNLPQGARVGTSSLRRVCQLKALRPDLIVEVLRGNVDTRLRKVADGVVDAAVLACAGLDRLGYGDRISERLRPTDMLPAIGQGALAIETRDGDARVARLVGILSDPAAQVTVAAERALLAALGGGCRTPLGGHAILGGDRLTELTIDGLVGRPDGTQLIRAQVQGVSRDAVALGQALAADLLAKGAGDILRELEGHA